VCECVYVCVCSCVRVNFVYVLLCLCLFVCMCLRVGKGRACATQAGSNSWGEEDEEGSREPVVSTIAMEPCLKWNLFKICTVFVNMNSALFG
jgi:hypothetical protein